MNLKKITIIIVFVLLAFSPKTIWGAGIGWYVSSYLYDNTGSTPLTGGNNGTTGSFVQLIWVGPNGIIDNAAYTGDGTTNDDVVVDFTYVGSGAAAGDDGWFYGATVDEGGDVQDGRTYFIRTWKEPSSDYSLGLVPNLASGYYGNSSTLTWIKTTPSYDLVDFTATGNISTTLISILPVELTSFEATVSKNIVLFNWQTATEVNNYGFEVERNSNPPLNPLQGGEGTEQQDWEKIGFVEGNGNSNSPKQYSYSDNNINAGKYSYRLKQIDFDGQFEYSEIVNVEINAPDKFELSQNYPNPFNPSTSIEYTVPSNVKGEIWNVKLVVYDILGNEVAVLVNGVKEAGSYEVNFDANNLTSGVYLYRLNTSSGYTMTKKLMLLK